MKHRLFPLLSELLWMFPLLLLIGSLLVSGRFFTNMCWYYSIRTLKGDPPQIYSTLCSSLFSCILQILASLTFQFPQLRKIAGFCLGSFSLCSLETRSRALWQGGSLCFPSLGDYSPIQSLSNIWKQLFHTFLWCFVVCLVVSGRRVNLFPIIASKMEALSIHFLMIQLKYYVLSKMFHNPFSSQESFSCSEPKPFQRSSNKKPIYYYNAEKISQIFISWYKQVWLLIHSFPSHQYPL